MQSSCGSNANNGNIKSIFSYSGAPAGDPTTNGTTTDPSSCADESRLVPYVKKDVPTDQFVPQAQVLDVNLQLGITTNGQNIVQWNVNGSIINVDWEKPTLQYVKDGNTSYTSNMNLISLPLKNQVSTSLPNAHRIACLHPAVDLLDHSSSGWQCPH